MLARLAEFDLAAAERVHGRLMAAEESSEIAELGRTYQRVARSLRQTLALRAKLKRDAARPRPRPRSPGRRRAASPWRGGPRGSRDAVTRVIWNEAERPRTWTSALRRTGAGRDFRREVVDDGFCDEAFDDHVARICLELGLPADAAEGWRDLPDPPDHAGEPDEPPTKQANAEVPHRANLSTNHTNHTNASGPERPAQRAPYPKRTTKTRKEHGRRRRLPCSFRVSVVNLAEPSLARVRKQTRSCGSCGSWTDLDSPRAPRRRRAAPLA